MPPLTATVTIQNLLDRMTNDDKDFRYMATNDLIGELQRENIWLDDESETKVTHQVIGLLRDKNGEVQNVAVKCLGHLVGKIKDERRQLVIKSLCLMLKSDQEQCRDIASVALKTIVLEIPISKRMIEIINDDLNPNLLVAIANNHDVNVQLESLEILSELVNRIGAQLGVYHERMQQKLIKQLESDRSAVRKRAMNALSNLLACCSDELFNSTIVQLLQALIKLSPKTEEEAKSLFAAESSVSSSSKTLIQCMSTIVRVAGHRSKLEQLDQIMPVIYSFCKVDDDELREHCLQTFEAYVKRCPVNVSRALPDIIQTCLSYLSYDPNYNYEDEDDDQAMDVDGDEDVEDVEDVDDDESADDYSDDDDLSWKVRRASAKCLEAIVLSRRDMVNDFFITIAPILVARFKEREESVKSDIIQTFVSLLKQTRLTVNEGNQSSMAVIKLKEMMPVVVGRATSLLREKAIKTRQMVLQMLTEIITVLPNALADHVGALIPGILFSLADKYSTSNMKIDALVFVQELIKTHQAPIFYPHIGALLPAVVNSVSDSFYRIAAEALALLTLIVGIIRPPNHNPMAGYETVLSSIYEKTLDRMSRTDLDVEIKERSISCMGQIIATFGDKMSQQLPIALGILHERLNSDTTRLTCIKALIKIANSPLPMCLDCLFPKAFATVAPFLKKNSRPLRISTLILIENVVRRSADLLDSESAQTVVLVDIPNLINESDLYVSQLALAMLTTFIKTHKAFHSIVPEKVLPEVLQLIRSPLLQGTALQAMLQFLTTIVQSSFPGLDHSALFCRLVEPIYKGISIHKQAYNSTAKAIAAISTHNTELSLMTVQRLIGDSVHYRDNDAVYTLVLLALGEIGKVTNLGDVPNLVDVLLQAFNSASEDVKSAGSYALGCVAIGNMNKFLPIILHEIEARNKRQYLILHSLREVISGGHLEHIEPVWNLLMKHCECQEEGTRNVVSECLGKLTFLNPEVLLQRLLEVLKKDYANKPQARSTIVAAVKFTISDQPQDVDQLLRQCIGEFLSALQDEDINVRRVALITLNSAAHNKPSLISDLLPKILPLLYRETQIRPELIREVEMGPFKHQVDDGLDSRKAAFECMYTLLDTCQNQLDIFEFLTHVENGLKDHYDIKMLTYLMLTRLSALHPSAVLQRMDRLIYPIEDVCRTKPKENAVKQEHEKQDELKRSALRALDGLKSVPNADKHPVLVRFLEDCVLADKELSELYSSIHRDSTQSSNDFTNNKMDFC